MRAIAAFALAPMVPALLSAPLLLLPIHNAQSLVSFILYICLIWGYPIALLVGVPAFLYLRRKGWLRFRHFFFAGALVGTIAPLLMGGSALLIFLVHPTDAAQLLEGAKIVGGLLLLGTGVGSAISSAFWLIGVAELKRVAVFSRGSRSGAA